MSGASRRRYQSVIRPALLNSLKQRCVFYSGAARHLRQGALRAIRKIDDLVVANVVHLFSAGCPPTIFRLVVAVGVYAIKRVFRRWGASHVFEKGLVALQPTIAHADTATSVVSVVVSRRQVAPILHMQPCAIFLRLLASFAMCFLRFATFGQKAAAAFCVAALQRAALNKGLATAIALTLPSQKATAGRVGALLKNEEAPKALPDQVYFFHQIIIHSH